MRTEKRPPFYLFVPLILFALLISCEEKPDFIRGDLLPSGVDFRVAFDSLEVTYGYTKPADSIPSGFKEYYLVGNISDPFFGISRAEILTTISPSINSRGFGNNALADSVILYLPLQEKVGDGALPMHLKLYELTEQIHFDSNYFSNGDVTGKYREPEIGSITLTEGNTLMKVFITDQVFINKFLTAHDSILRSEENLQKFMNGIYFTTNQAIDKGNMFSIDFDDPQNYLYFYYRNDTASGQSQYFSLESDQNGRINLFDHDPAGYPLEEYLQNGSDNDSLIFVQSMAGVSSVIRFPGLEHWLDSMPVAINEARLIISIADTAYTMQKKEHFPDRLNLYLVHEDGRYSLTYDNMLDAENYGGIFSPSSRTYSFSIKAQIQSILAGDVKNLQMVLVPGNTGQTLSRGALYGWNSDPGKRMRLEITYTRL